MVRSQIISKVQKCQQSQTLLMTQSREVLRKCHPGSIVFILSQTKYRDCEIFKRSEITRAPCRRCNGEAVPRAEKFGDLITADNKVLHDGGESRNNHRYAVVVHDLATQWTHSDPRKTKRSQETEAFAKVSRALIKAERHLNCQLTRIWQRL